MTVKFLTTAAVLLALIAPAPATALDIYNDQGGNIAKRFEMIKELRKSGEKVRIIGECVSACTLILTLPAEQLCAVKGATLGFHAMMRADKPGSDRPLIKNGEHVMSPAEDQEFFASQFSAKIHNWIHMTGVLKSTKVTYSPAIDFVQECNKVIPPIKLTPVGDTWYTETSPR